MSRMDDTDTRIRHRARALWVQEGCPEGRADAHWAIAKEEIAMEEVRRAASRPEPVPPLHPDDIREE